jgi:hypothetical protein
LLILVTSVGAFIGHDGHLRWRSGDPGAPGGHSRTGPEVGIEPAHLSQQLAVLRRATW